MKKRRLCLVLVAVTLIGMMPMTTFADEEIPEFLRNTYQGNVTFSSVNGVSIGNTAKIVIGATSATVTVGDQYEVSAADGYFLDPPQEVGDNTKIYTINFWNEASGGTVTDS